MQRRTGESSALESAVLVEYRGSCVCVSRSERVRGTNTPKGVERREPTLETANDVAARPDLRLSSNGQPKRRSLPSLDEAVRSDAHIHTDARAL